MSDVENPRKTEYPKIVSRAEWLRARKELLVPLAISRTSTLGKLPSP